MKKVGLLEVLKGIEDSRRERSVWYPLHEVLFIIYSSCDMWSNILHKGRDVRQE